MIGKTNSISGGLVYIDKNKLSGQLLERTPTVINTNAQTNIPDYAFYHYTTLTEVNMPGVVRVGKEAFRGSDNLSIVILPNAQVVTPGYFHPTYPVLDHPEYNALYECPNLTTLILPSLKYVEEQQFSNRSKLKTVDVKSASSIGYYAFGSCPELENIQLTNALAIDSSAFAYCKKLTSINLPKTKRIGASAFNSCTSLIEIILGNDTVCTLVNTNALPASSTQNITIYVPQELIEDYKIATNWSTLYNNGYITFEAISE